MTVHSHPDRQALGTATIEERTFLAGEMRSFAHSDACLRTSDWRAPYRRSEDPMPTQTQATTENGSDGSHPRTASSPRIRALGVDDHAPGRLGPPQLLEGQPDFQVLARSETTPGG